MEALISYQSNNLQSVPESYILPPERRPGNVNVPLCNTIPIIDLQKYLGGDRKGLIQDIIKASQEYGFFQITNHGVSDELMSDVVKVGEEFFQLPDEEKASFCCEATGGQILETCRVKTSIEYAQESVHFWRDNLRHPCHPLQDYIHQWPTKPGRYRDVVGRYSVEVRKLSLRILDLICEGLGLEPGYFDGELSKTQLMTTNYYPPCPDPTLVLGLPKHADPNLLTILNQGKISGLHVFKDNQWLAVEPTPNALVVNINYMLQVISNGKLKSADHRAVTNSEAARTSVVSFIIPCVDSIIEPAKTLVNESNPRIYKAFKFVDFFKTYGIDTREGGDPLRHYMI